MLQKSCCGPEESTWSAGVELLSILRLLARRCGASVDPPSAGQEMLQKSCCGPEESTWSAGELINNAGLLKCSRRAKATLAAGEVMSSTNMPFTHQTPRWCGASVDPPSAGQEMLQKSCCGPEESTWSAGELINNAGLLKCSRRAKATLAAGEVMSSTNMPFTHQTPRWCGASVDPPSAGQEMLQKSCCGPEESTWSAGELINNAGLLKCSRRAKATLAAGEVMSSTNCRLPIDTTMVWSFCRSSVCWPGGEVTENLEPLQ
ncbi:hypothetical protein KUCAC02_034930 [Chaenocephalus aceratus]|nr:hypothetical protein KUCAC02_034930 [Chaenocephalus aceratus]